MMGRIVAAAALALLVFAGCSNTKDLQKTVASLNSQLQSKEQDIDVLQKKLDALERNKMQLDSKIAALEADKARLMTEHADAAKNVSELEKQRRELELLLTDIGELKAGPEGNYIVLPSEVLFAPGKIDITARGKQGLQKVAQYLKEKPEQIIRIDGHTDSDPIKISGWENNHHLAAMRALAVFKSLLSLGVPEKRMYICGYGPNKHAVPEKTEADKEKNRRVEILLVPTKSMLAEELLKSMGK